MGGTFYSGRINSKFTIYDLTGECLNFNEYDFAGDKLYLPGVYDPDSKDLHSFSGLCDQENLKHQRINIADFLCTCRIVPFAAVPMKKEKLLQSAGAAENDNISQGGHSASKSNSRQLGTDKRRKAMKRYITKDLMNLQAQAQPAADAGNRI